MGYNLIEIIAKLDWFERVDAIARAVSGQRSHRFAVDRSGGWSGQMVEDMLEAHGIRIWDRGFDHENLYFRVKKQQARWAEYLMIRNGVQVVSNLVDPRNAGAPRSVGPNEYSTKPDLIADIITAIFY